MLTGERTQRGKRIMTTLVPNKPDFGPAAIDEPFAWLRSMRRDMFRPVFEPFYALDWDLEAGPPVNLWEKDGVYMLEVALPGYRKDDIQIETGGDSVTITGTFKADVKDEKVNVHRRELRRGSFARTIALPHEIDVEKVVAKFEDGVLKLSLPALPTIAHKPIAIT